MKDAVGDNLPKWLYWDSEHATLIGIALDSDLGPHYISVEAVGLPLNGTHSSSAADVFTIHVREDSPISAATKWIPAAGAAEKSRDVHCEKGEEVITMMVTISANIEMLDALQRTKLIREAAKALNLDISQVRLWPVAYGLSMKQEILAAGPGESGAGLKPKGSIIGIRIGCGSLISPELNEKLEILEKKLTVPELFGKSLDNHVIGWTVSATKIEPRRRKRQYGRDITPTPTISTPHPTHTSTVEFSASTTPETTTTTQRRTTRTAPPVVEPSTTPVYWQSSPPQATPDLPATKKPGDSGPRSLNSISEIRCYKNTVCYFDIQHDTFMDTEDGDTTKLRLTLISQQETKSSEENWLSLKVFDEYGEKKQILKGLPKSTGEFRYILQARDSGGSIVTDAFVVTVTDFLKENEKFTHYFSLKLEDVYNEFAKNSSKQAELLERISNFYEDNRPIYITMGSIERGSVVVSWSNNTIPTDRCDLDAINLLQRKIFRPNKKISKEFQQHLEPAFKIIDGSLKFSSHCDAESPHEHVGGKPAETTEPPKASSDSMMITTVIP